MKTSFPVTAFIRRKPRQAGAQVQDRGVTRAGLLGHRCEFLAQPPMSGKGPLSPLHCSGETCFALFPLGLLRFPATTALAPAAFGQMVQSS